MYLISVEGGDGSGKGEAVRILSEIANEFPFPNIAVTHEPRRHSELGKLALQSVKEGKTTPLNEAGLFAADRLDHSHTWIKPRLQQGTLVISDRNIHSSLVYQGYVGKLGIERVAKMNAAALIPDLVFWIDCDPKKAMKRIQTGTLRMSSSGKQEYFETTDIQKLVREGFSKLFTKKLEVPKPFHKSTIVGPILNEGGLDELERQLRNEMRGFFNRKPVPLNCTVDEVDIHLLKSLAGGVSAQKRLPGGPPTNSSLLENWLKSKTPSEWMRLAEEWWPIERAKAADVPQVATSRAAWSVIGTLSVMDTTDVPTLHRRLGPARMITKRHTQRMVRWLEEERWIHKQQNHVPFREAQLFKLRNERLGYGRLCLALWPLRSEFSTWRRMNPDGDWDNALQEISGNTKSDKPSANFLEKLSSVYQRLEMLTSGHEGCPVPSNFEELALWWSTPPPQNHSS